MIENELKELGISSENLGTSTGNTWFGKALRSWSLNLAKSIGGFYVYTRQRLPRLAHPCDALQV